MQEDFNHLDEDTLFKLLKLVRAQNRRYLLNRKRHEHVTPPQLAALAALQDNLENAHARALSRLTGD